MIYVSRRINWLAAAMLLCSQPTLADIYKCVDADGLIAYSQAPCPGKPQLVKVDSQSASTDAVALDCRAAYRFAYETAQSMQSGTSSADAFDRYGGLDSMSRGSLNLINFVYGYRASNSMTAERIAGLAKSMCQSNSLQNVSCDDLPISFTDKLGGCDAGELLPEADSVQDDIAAFELPVEPEYAPADAELVAVGDDAGLCKKNIQAQIDQLDEQMRSGYTSSQGDAFRARRRQLREQMRRC